MKQMHILKNIAHIIIILLFAGLYGCQNHDVYDPNSTQLPPADNYFDFNTDNKVALDIQYNIPGYQALLAVYTENPIDDRDGIRTLKEGITPVFKAYTDQNCNYSGEITLPTAVKKVYLCSGYLFVPECIELEIANGQITYSNSTAAAPTSRVQYDRNKDFVTTGFPFTINASYSLYSLCEWGNHGRLPSDYITETVKNLGNHETIGTLFTRLQSKLGGIIDGLNKKQNNSNLISTEDLTNVSISKFAADGEVIQSARIDFVYLNERAGYKSTLGYYYYNTADFKEGKIKIEDLPKYIILPNVSQGWDDPYDKSYGNSAYYNAPLERGQKIRLKYFGENYDKPASDNFPSGYSIGWFILPDAYNTSNNKINTQKPFYYSNQSANSGGKSRCITVFDKTTQKMIIGFEDGNDNSYEDILFYVEADPVKAIVDPAKPGVPSIDEGEEDINIPDQTNIAEGTLAFEDIWPDGGDYDMNDVVVEYKIEVSFNTKNQITKIVDKFIPVHNGAIYKNAFGYQIPEALASKQTTFLNGTKEEAGQNLPTFLVFTDIKSAVEAGIGYSVTREFTSPLSYETNDAASIMKNYNPFILPNYQEESRNRTEVHLPKKTATAFANPELSGTKNDAYFLDKEGAYPFAIQLPITNFHVVTERVSIDKEYPKFKTWADSKGSQDTDWYLHYEGPNQ